MKAGTCASALGASVVTRSSHKESDAAPHHCLRVGRVCCTRLDGLRRREGRGMASGGALCHRHNATCRSEGSSPEESDGLYALEDIGMGDLQVVQRCSTLPLR